MEAMDADIIADSWVRRRHVNDFDLRKIMQSQQAHHDGRKTNEILRQPIEPGKPTTNRFNLFAIAVDRVVETTLAPVAPAKSTKTAACDNNSKPALLAVPICVASTAT